MKYKNKTNVENFDDGLTRVSPKGKFHASTCGKEENKGAYTFRCGSLTRKGKIQYCKECRRRLKNEN